MLPLPAVFHIISKLRFGFRRTASRRPFFNFNYFFSTGVSYQFIAPALPLNPTSLQKYVYIRDLRSPLSYNLVEWSSALVKSCGVLLPHYSPGFSWVDQSQTVNNLTLNPYLLFQGGFNLWTQFGRLFNDVPLSFRSLARLTIGDNLTRPLNYDLTSKLVERRGFFYKINPRNDFGLKFRRIRTLWVSKVTQCTLTPARNHFLKYHNLKYLYQKKITKFVFNFYSLKLHDSFSSLPSSLKLVFLSSGLAYSLSQFCWFLRNNFIFVNFFPLRNYTQSFNLVLGFGDTLSLFITPKTILMTSVWESSLLRAKRRFFTFLRSYRVRSSRKPPKQPSFRIPSWVDTVYLNYGVSRHFLETDLLTQTVIYLNLSLNLSARSLSQQDRRLLPFATTIRSLNWKSLT